MLQINNCFETSCWYLFKEIMEAQNINSYNNNIIKFLSRISRTTSFIQIFIYLSVCLAINTPECRLLLKKISPRYFMVQFNNNCNLLHILWVFSVSKNKWNVFTVMAKTFGERNFYLPIPKRKQGINAWQGKLEQSTTRANIILNS